MIAILVIFALSVALFIGAVYFWNSFVEQGRFDATRKYLLMVLTIISSTEVCCIGFPDVH